jgi:uncharacterized protein
MTTSATVARLAAQLTARLEREPDVVVAYVFGSHARGTARPDSDVDVAVLLAEGSDPARRQVELSAALASGVDVVVLNTAPVELGYRVLRDGVLILDRDERARTNHWVRTVDRYLDAEPLRRVLALGLHRRLEEDRFGRP